MVEILATAIIAVAIGHGVAVSFPWFQWIKRRLKVAEADLDRLDDLRYQLAETGDKLTRKQNTQRLIAKALHCHSCCSFWTALVIGWIGLEWWAWLPCAIVAHCIASLIYSLQR